MEKNTTHDYFAENKIRLVNISMCMFNGSTSTFRCRDHTFTQ